MRDLERAILRNRHRPNGVLAGKQIRLDPAFTAAA
jgi:hypothetical protein